jgi:hypothetical protein
MYFFGTAVLVQILFTVLLITYNLKIFIPSLTAANIILGIFFTGATTHCGFVFCSPLAGLQPPCLRGFLITHNDAPQSVGLLWTSDQSVAETST